MLILKILILLTTLQFSFFNEAKDEFSIKAHNQCAIYVSGSPRAAIAELEAAWMAEVGDRLLVGFINYSAKYNVNMNQLRLDTKITNIQSYIHGINPINVDKAKTLARIFELELDYVLAKDVLAEFNKTQFEVRPEHFFKKYNYNLNRVYRFLFWDVEIEREFLIQCLRNCPDDLFFEEFRRRRFKNH